MPDWLARRDGLGGCDNGVGVDSFTKIEGVRGSDFDDLLVGVTSAVVADVDDDAFLVPELIDLVLELDQ